MEKNKTQNFKGLLTACVLAVGLLLAFQNCGEVTEKAIFPSTASELSEYPYDVKVGMVGYMSCEGMTPGLYDPTKFFSIAIGSAPVTANGGIRFSDSFRSKIVGEGLSSAEVSSLILNNDNTSSARMQLSLRSLEQLGTASPIGILNTLDSSKISNFFPVLNSLTNSLYGLTGSSRISSTGAFLFRSTLSFVEGSGLVAVLAGGQASILVGFQKGSGQAIVNVSNLEPSKAQGVALEARGGFDRAIYPYAGGKVSGEPRVLNTGFSQRNAALANSPANRSQMVCPPTAQYRIVENRTWGSTGGASAGRILSTTASVENTPLNLCNQPGSRGTSAEEMRNYDAANFLLNGGSSSGFWTIDQVNRCIISNNDTTALSSSGGTCYPYAHRGTAAVNWNANASVSAASNPNYFSICFSQ